MLYYIGRNISRGGDLAQLGNLLRCWCEKKMIFYLEFMSLLGRCYDIYFILNDAIECAQVCCQVKVLR